jgi:hypothetical protein
LRLQFFHTCFEAFLTAFAPPADFTFTFSVHSGVHPLSFTRIVPGVIALSAAAATGATGIPLTY